MPPKTRATKKTTRPAKTLPPPNDLTLNWLLEPNNPSVRYLTLTTLLDRPQNHPDAVAARAAIMHTGTVPAILDLQQPAGHWAPPTSFYSAKYRGTAWQLMILAEHYADGADDRVRRACEFILTHSQDHASGGFSVKAAKRGGGMPSLVVPCLTGNMVWSLLRLGYFGDPRVNAGIDWLTRYIRFDDGDSAPPPDFPYNRWETCYGKHSCFMGIVKGLKALAEIPVSRRNPAVRRTLDAGIDFLLRHHIFKRSHNLDKVSRPGWTHFGFPRMYQTDALEITLLLRTLGISDQRMREALTLIESQRLPNGRWLLEDTFNGKFQVDIEQYRAPSKWITLHALRVLTPSKVKS